MTVSSRHNPLLKMVREAVSTGRATPDGTIAAEGPHLLQEALHGDWKPVQVFATPGARSRFNSAIEQSRAEVIEVSEAAFNTIASTEHTQGVVTLLRPRIWSDTDLRNNSRPLLIVLDGVQDPGNAGTIVRSAEAFGGSGVLMARGSVRVSNPKFLRATAGSIFRLPYLELAEITNLAGLSIFSLSADAERTIKEVDLRPGVALVTGSEGRGVSAAYREISTAVRVPAIQVESLNAAVACSIALYEASQQRQSS